jgi:hypothetical protein
MCLGLHSRRCASLGPRWYDPYFGANHVKAAIAYASVATARVDGQGLNLLILLLNMNVGWKPLRKS